MTTHPTDLDTLLKEESLDFWKSMYMAARARLDAAEASALTARRDALEEAAKWHTGKAKHHTFLANVRLRGETTDDQLRELARAELHAQSAYHLRTLASTVPGGEETRFLDKAERDAMSRAAVRAGTVVGVLEPPQPEMKE